MRRTLLRRWLVSTALRLLALAVLAGLAETIIVVWRATRIAEVDTWPALCAAAFGAGATAAMRLFPGLMVLELSAAAVRSGVTAVAGRRVGHLAGSLAWGFGAAAAALWVLAKYERFRGWEVIATLAGVALGLSILALALGSTRTLLRRGGAALALLGFGCALVLDARTSFGQYPTLHLAVQWLALALVAYGFRALGSFLPRLALPLRGGVGVGALATCVLVALPLSWSLGASGAEHTMVRKLGWMTLPQDQLMKSFRLNPECEAGPELVTLPEEARAEAFLRHANFDALPQDLAGRNLIFVVMDAVRADHVGAYGSKLKLTPNIDTLGRKSIVFENAYASSSGTIGTLGALFCMAPPSWVEMTTEEVFWRGQIGKGCTMMAERLSARGYTSRAHIYFYVAGTLSERSGFLRGFENVVKGESDLDVVNTALVALEGKKARDARPAFLWLQLGQAHQPYTPSPGYTPRDDSEKARYEAAIASIDAAVGALQSGLKRLGLWKKSVVVVFSDHGEEFGDHGGRHHNRTVNDEMLRVPLIVHDARVGARRVREDVVLSDLGAWLLWKHRGVPDGDVVSRVASSAGLLYGALGGVRVAELLTNTGIRVALIKGPRKAMRDLTSRYDELYDRGRDPGERRNLIGLAPGDPLLAALDRYEKLRDCTRRARVTPLWGGEAPRNANTSNAARARRVAGP